VAIHSAPNLSVSHPVIGDANETVTTPDITSREFYSPINMGTERAKRKIPTFCGLRPQTDCKWRGIAGSWVL
jgi:hypothetical protein